MAEIQTVQSGLRVITHIKGRVYRAQQGQRSNRHQREQNLSARTSGRPPQRRRICLLSARDARWLMEYGISQPCHGPECLHSHHTRAQIDVLVKSGNLRWVGKGENVACWPDPREWRGMGEAMQLVPIGAGTSKLERREIARASMAQLEQSADRMAV